MIGGLRNLGSSKREISVCFAINLFVAHPHQFRSPKINRQVLVPVHRIVDVVNWIWVLLASSTSQCKPIDLSDLRPSNFVELKNDTPANGRMACVHSVVSAALNKFICAFFVEKPSAIWVRDSCSHRLHIVSDYNFMRCNLCIPYTTAFVPFSSDQT